MDSDTQTELLKQFVSSCKRNPGILHQPRFAFYKEYLERLFLYFTRFKILTHLG